MDGEFVIEQRHSSPSSLGIHRECPNSVGTAASNSTNTRMIVVGLASNQNNRVNQFLLLNLEAPYEFFLLISLPLRRLSISPPPSTVHGFIASRTNDYDQFL